MADKQILNLNEETVTTSADLYLMQKATTSENVKVKGSNIIPANTITPEKLVTGTGTNWLYQSWTPSYTGLTVGSGTVVARYIRIGNVVQGYFIFTFGAGSVVGDVKISMPVAPRLSGTRITLGNVGFDDNSGTEYTGVLWIETDGKFRVLVNNVGATYPSVAAISATIPFTWATNDQIQFTFTYEAA